MKSIIISITMFIVMSVGNPAWSQSPEQQGHPPIPSTKQIEKRVEELAEKLTLTEEQKDQILGMYKEHFSEMKTKAQEERKILNAKREEMASFRKDFEEQVKAVLSEEQQSLFNEFQKNHHPPMKQRQNR